MEIASLAGAVEGLLYTDEKFDVVSGVSAGSLLVFELYRRKMNMEEVILKAARDGAFSVRPFNSKGRPTLAAIWRILRGKPSLGSLGGLRKDYMKLVSREDFERYLNDYYGDTADAQAVPRLCVMSVNVQTAAMTLHYAHDCSYESWVDAVVSSCSVPIIAPPVFVREQGGYVDGGVRSNTATICFTQGIGAVAPQNITKIVEVYGRSADLPEAPFYNAPLAGNNVQGMTAWTFAVMTRQISLFGSYYTNLWCKHNQVPLEQHFVGGFMESMFDTNHERLVRSYAHGFRSIINP